MLEPWTASNDLQDIPLPDLEDEQEIWEVEDIETHYNTAKGRKYLVKWKGWPAEYNTWEPEEHLVGAPIIVRNYLKKRKTHAKWDDKE